MIIDTTQPPTMKQHVAVTLTLNLWLDATMSQDDMAEHIRAQLPLAFGEELTSMQNPVDIIAIVEEFSLYSADYPRGVFSAAPRLLEVLENTKEGLHGDNDFSLEDINKVIALAYTDPSSGTTKPNKKA